MIALSGLSLIAVAIPVALVAQAAATGGDDGSTAPIEAAADGGPSAVATSSPDAADDGGATAPAPAPALIGFESCTIINGLIPADADGDGTTDTCWALEGAGDRPAECPADEPYLFIDTNGDGIVDECQWAEFSCDDGHPYDSDDDGRVDACLRWDEWVLSLRPTATAVPPVTATVVPLAPRATATPRPPRPTVTPRPRPTATPRPTPTREPYWSQPG